MADNEIRVVITGVASDLRRALEGAKGDLGDLSTKIKEVPNEIRIDVQAQTAIAQERLRSLRDMARDVPNRINIEASADTGVADAKLRLLERQARQTEEAIARAQLGSLLSGGGGGGGGLGSVFSGGVPGAGPLALGATAAPLIAAGAGSVTAVAGSAGAGLLGAGALGTAALGAGGVGLGSLLAVIKPALTGITAVTTALDNLDAAQQKYGEHSKQAATAQKDLNAAMKEAGPQASQIAQQLTALSDQWTKVSAPAAKALDQIIVPALNTIKDLMPTVAAIAKQSFDAIGKALDPIFKGLSSPEFKKVLTDLGNTFAKLASPLIDAFANIMRAFFNVAIAASPYLIQIAKAFDSWSLSLAAALEPGKHLNDLIKGLVGQLHSWWELAKAVGGIMVTIFSAGAATGKSLVDQLTALVNKWNAWLNTKQGQQDLKQFFVDSANLLKAVLGALGPVVKLIASMSIGLIPAMTLLLKPLANILADISKWVNGISKSLPPVLNALPGLAVAAGVLASWAALKGLVSGVAGMLLGKAGIGAAAGEGGAAAGAAGFNPFLALFAAASAGVLVGGAALFKATNPGTVRSTSDVAKSAIGQEASRAGSFANALDLTNLLNQARQLPQVIAKLRDMGGTAKDVGDLSKAAFATFSAGIDHISGKLANLSPKQLKALQNQAVALAADPSLDQYTKQINDLADATEKALIGKAAPAFKQMADEAGKSLDQINLAVKVSSVMIPSLLGKGSKAAQEALSQNFLIAIKDVQASMAKGIVSTAAGIREINKLMAQALNALGVPVKASDVAAIGLSQAMGLLGPAQSGSTSSLSGGHFAIGGFIGTQGEKGRDEVPVMVGRGEAILNHGQQQVVNTALGAVGIGGLNGLFARTMPPHYMAHGGYAGYSLPLPRSEMLPGSWSIDQGVDIPAPAGTPEFAIGPGVIVGEGISGFGPSAPTLRISAGPLAGREIYYGHAGPDLVKVGQSVGAGQQISEVGAGIVGLSTGPHIEIGFAPPGANGAGSAMAMLLNQLMGGAGVTGIPGGGGAVSITAPKWHGPGGMLGQMGQAVLKKVASAASQYVAAHSFAGIGSAGVSGTPAGSGDVERQVYQFFSAHGFDKIAIAGMLGNAVQESAMNPNTPGGGLWQQISNFGQGTGGTLLNQMDVMLPQIMGIRGALNAAGSPAEAATIFMNSFERPAPATENLPNRISGADAAFAAGFAGGGFAHAATGRRPSAPKLKSGSISGLQNLDKVAKHITQQMQHATDLSNQYAGLSGSFGTTEAAAQYLNPDGSLNAAGVAQHIADDQKLIGLDQQLLGIYTKLEPEIEHELSKLLGNVSKDQRKITHDEKQITKNKAQIAALRTASLKLSAPTAPSNIAKLEGQLKAIRQTFSTKIGKLGSGKAHASERSTLHLQENQQINAVEGQIADIRRRTAAHAFSVASQKHRIALQINGLEGQDTKLTGDISHIRGLLTGANGSGSQDQALSTIESAAGSFGTVLWGSDGRFQGIDQTNQGVIFTTKTDLQALGQDIAHTTPTSTGPDLAALNALKDTQIANLRTDLATSQSQFGVFSGFAPLMAGRLLGSFATGIDRVPQTGPYLLHRDEMVVPDPYGPQANRAATVHTAQGAVQIDLHFEGDSGQLVKLVDARMNQKALSVVSSHAGQRARLMAGVRGR